MIWHRRAAATPSVLGALGPALFCTLWFGCPGIGEEKGQPMTPVPIVVGPQASRLERLAAQELKQFLTSRYGDQQRFGVTDQRPAQGPAVVLGTPASNPQLARLVEKERLAEAGSFVVEVVEADRRQIGVVAGADPRATLHAVYALAEQLGFAFYLSYDGAAVAKAGLNERFSFEGWHLADTPLTGDRIVFNWHDFLSSCSTWDLPQWQHWIRQSARMRYTAVMVHAYGNNPMVCFSHNGQTKPVGYLSTTAKGRDWGTQHVNDVRRLYGAEGLFDGPVFGCAAAMAPDDRRVAAAKSLMKKVFAYAEDQGMVRLVYELRIDQGQLEVQMNPVRGRAILCGVILEPIGLDKPEPVVRKKTPTT